MHSKGNHPQNEDSQMNGGNICKWYNQWGLSIQNISTAPTTQYKTQKNRQKIWRLFQGRHIDGQQAQEKCNSNQRNIDQNHNELSPHTC